MSCCRYTRYKFFSMYEAWQKVRAHNAKKSEHVELNNVTEPPNYINTNIRDVIIKRVIPTRGIHGGWSHNVMLLHLQLAACWMLKSIPKGNADRGQIQPPNNYFKSFLILRIFLRILQFSQNDSQNNHLHNLKCFEISTILS